MIVGILNHEEAVEPLANKMLIRYLQQNTMVSWKRTEAYVESCQRDFDQDQILRINFENVNECIKCDLAEWKDTVITKYKANYRRLVNWLSSNLQNYDIDKSYLIDLSLTHTKKSFVRSLARQIGKREPTWILRGDDCDPNMPVVLRNIVGNEKILADKLTNTGQMWFVDSGYTNFLTEKKTWHRLVKDHIHHDIQNKSFPADRLGMFPAFPEAWRTGGDTILVVENSAEYYKMLGISLQDWSYQIRKTLNRLTDKRIEFRAKTGTRKTRVSVYDTLKTDPDKYYCVISQNSVAAIESIWLGIPVITLGTHVSVPVARTSITDINDLYRGPIGDWLCALSYCQFTEKEILDGTAAKIVRKFHHV